MFKFNWRIENFSMLCQNTGEFIESPAFEIKSLNNIGAYIRLYPKGIVNDEYVSFEIFTTGKSVLFEVGAKPKLCLAKKNSSATKEFEVSSNRQKLSNYIYRKDFSEIFAFQDIFKFEDNVDVECVFQKADCSVPLSPVTSCAKTVVQIETQTHDIFLSKIIPSASWKQNLDCSKIFVVEQTNNFQLALKLQHDFQNNALEISNVSALSSVIIMCCRLSVINKSERIELVYERHRFNASSQNEIWKMAFAIDADSIKPFSILRCETISSTGKEAKFNNPSVKNALHDSVPCTESDTNCRLLLKNMFDTRKFSDVVFQVGNTQFPAHKCVLGSVSEVFSAMFTNEMVEKEANVVHITDIDADIVDKMLEFIYTGKIGILDLENVFGLYPAADKYQIMELKKLCTSYLQENLSMDTVLTVLELADMHQDSGLEDSALNFICTNRVEIFNSDNWKNLMKKNAELAARIMLHICQMP